MYSNSMIFEKCVLTERQANRQKDRQTDRNLACCAVGLRGLTFSAPNLFLISLSYIKVFYFAVMLAFNEH